MGLIFVILASLIFGSYPTIQERVLASGASPLGMVIICNTVAGLSALIVGLIKKESFRINKKELGTLALVGVLGLFITDYLLNIAYTMIPVGFTTMIHFLYPSLVCILMSIFFKEKTTVSKIAAIIISILGLVFISGGDFSGNKLGVLVALATAFAYAFYMIGNDKTSVARVPLMARSFYLNLFVLLAALVTNGCTRTAVLPRGGINIGLSVLVGVLLCTAIVLLNAGIKRMGAGKASFINMLEPITSLVVSAMVLHYHISGLAILGCVLILGSLLLVSIGGTKE